MQESEQFTLGPFTIKGYTDGYIQIRYTPGASRETSHVLTSQELDRTCALVLKAVNVQNKARKQEG